MKKLLPLISALLFVLIINIPFTSCKKYDPQRDQIVPVKVVIPPVAAVKFDASDTSILGRIRSEKMTTADTAYLIARIADSSNSVACNYNVVTSGQGGVLWLNNPLYLVTDVTAYFGYFLGTVHPSIPAIALMTADYTNQSGQHKTAMMIKIINPMQYADDYGTMTFTGLKVKYATNYLVQSHFVTVCSVANQSDMFVAPNAPNPFAPQNNQPLRYGTQSEGKRIVSKTIVNVDILNQ